MGVKAEASSKPSKTLKFLYLYAGKARHSGTIREHMLAKIRALRLMTQERIKLVIKEVDLLNDAVRQDLSRDDVWHHIVQELDGGEWEEIMLSPRCNTHCQVLHARQGKPKPLRSLQHPMGFPWLQGGSKAKVDKANLLIQRCKEAAQRGFASMAESRWLLEHPEDLGRVENSIISS